MPEVTTTESIVRQAPFLEDYIKQLLTGAFGTEGDAKSGLQPLDIPAVQVAGLQPLQQAAITRAEEGVGVQDPFIQAGAQSIGTGLESLGLGAGALGQGVTAGLGSVGKFDPSQIAAFMDPFQKGATDVGLRELARQGDIRRTDIGSQAAGRGAFGGSRQGLVESELDRNLFESQRRLLQTDLSRNYTQALQAAGSAFENQQRRQQGLAQTLGQLGKGFGQLGSQAGVLGTQQAGLGELASQLGQQDINVLSQLGGQQQSVQQAILDAARQTTLQQEGEPYQRFGFLGDLLRGVPSSQSSLAVSTAPSPSPLSTLLGAGAALTGIGGLFKGSGIFGGAQP